MSRPTDYSPYWSESNAKRSSPSLLDWGTTVIGTALILLGAGSGVRRGAIPFTLGCLLLSPFGCVRSQGWSYNQRHLTDSPDPMIGMNRVDESLWESYPASDPPAYGPA